MRCDDIYSSNSTTYQFCHGNSSRPWFVYALEAPNGRKAEAAIFLASAIMFVLGVVLFGLSLFGRLSGRAALNPTVRVFLYASFALFLPLMSYMFSQAKDEAKLMKQQLRSYGEPHLPFRAQVILIWMLLVELLRKKVDTILAAMSSSPLKAVHQQTLWDAIDQIVRIAWIGYLIYSYVYGFRKPGFIILWALTLIKGAQRVAAMEVAKSSFAVSKNAHLIMGYTNQMLEEEIRDDEQEGNGITLLRKCWYAVMGEERLKREAGPDGFRVELPDSEDKKDLITVGDIWELAEGGDGKPADGLLTHHPRLKDLCLAFALFKLLQVRFQNLRVDEDVVAKNRDLIFRGLGGSSDGGGHDRDGDRSKEHAERAFNVIELELNFIMDYYHSVVPVVMCSPWFLFGNYIFVLLIVVNQTIMVLFITGNGHLLPIISCLLREVARMSHRAIDLFQCLGHKILKVIIIMFSSFNILISLLLFLTFLLMEAWEFFVYLLSDWFLVSMLCEYARKPKWQSSRCVRRALDALLWVKRVGRRPRAGMRLNQVCVLDLRRHTLWVIISKVLQHRFLGMPSVRVPREVKHAVFNSLRAKLDGEALNNGVAVLHRCGYTNLLWACESRSVTEVILTWHIATNLFEVKNAAVSVAARSAEEMVATMLSKYCAYLVACAPELLPEDTEGSKRVYKSVKRDLRNALSGMRRWSNSSSRMERVTRMEGSDPDAAASMGAELGKQLLEDCGFINSDVARGWALLAEIWTELMVYIAPSENIEGHAEALAQGGEFITLMWVVATHVGITR